MIRPSGLRDWNELWVFCKSEGDCTSEMGAGQFSIFGAYEEKSGHGWLADDRDEAMGEK
jgi:hypothetical protein